MQGFNLANQIFGHWRAISFIFLVYIVTECFAFSVKDNGDMFRMIFIDETAQHFHDAVDGACRLTF